MVATTDLNAGIELEESELRRYAAIVARLFAGRPLLVHGHHPHTRRAGDGIEFLDHRGYQPGDNLRDVDWLATLRAGKTQVRRYRYEASSDWTLCLDSSASMITPDAQKWLLARQLTAALAYLLVHLGHRVRLAMFGEKLCGLTEFGRGHGAYLAIVRELETRHPPPQGGASLLRTCLPAISSGGQAIVLSDFLTEDGMLDDLGRIALRTSHTRAIQLVDAAAVQLTEDGEATLFDVESGAQATVSISPPVLEKVQQRLQQHRLQLRKYCVKHRIAFTAADASQSWQQVLLQGIVMSGLGDA